jgi:uncharacterized protein (TIGR03435 family)
VQIRRVRIPCLAVAGLAVMAVAGRTLLEAQTLEFDVASVKPADGSNDLIFAHSTGMRVFAPRLLHGTFGARNASLKLLLSCAYNVPTSRISGPGWIDSERFDIEGKSPTGVPDSQLGPMLQALLKERFLLAVHGESKEMAAYDMVPAKGGVKLQPFDPDVRPTVPKLPYRGGSNMAGHGTMPEIADALARASERPVVDRTGMEGRFSYYVYSSPISAQPADSTAPDTVAPYFLDAVQEQMGLKLVPKKEPVEILVGDHAVRAPTPN